MTKEEKLLKLLEELEVHESVICLPCAFNRRVVDATTYLLNHEHKSPVCSDCCQREVRYGNAPDGLEPVEQPWVVRTIREERMLIEAGL